MRLISNHEVQRTSAGDLISAVETALRAHAAGGLSAPPRISVELGNGPEKSPDTRLVFTVGATGSAVGFRVYAIGIEPPLVQTTTVYNSATGELLGIVEGAELGARRTAAIGAVASNLLARPDAKTVGIIGSGRHAFTQLWALHDVRDLHEVRVFSPTLEHREEFARRCKNELMLNCVAVPGPRAAVAGADIVLLATTSAQPVVDASWIEPGTHVTTLGSTTVTRHEAPPELLPHAEAIVTDSVDQLLAYSEPCWLTSVPGQLQRTRNLSAVLTGSAPGRQSAAGITLFCSVGLAGTEVAIAELLLRSTASAG